MSRNELMNAKHEELIKIASESDREELRILFEAEEKTRSAYSGQPTAANKKDWDAAKEGLESTVDRLWLKYHPEAECFDNLVAAVRYLQQKGFKIRKSKIYQDRKKGMISVRADGTVLKKEVDRYAKTLNKLASSEEAAEAVQHQKTSKEAERLEKQVELLQIELDKERGKLISRDDADFEKASNIAVIIASLNQFAEMEAGNLIEIAAGDAARRPQVVKAMTDGFVEMFNRLVNAESYQLSISENKGI